MSWLSRLANVFRSSRLDEDLEDELRFHLEEKTRRLIAEGMPADTAAREARRYLGNGLATRERSRDVKLIGMYGVLTYTVVQRTREIAIRMALGARQGNVVRSVLGDVVWTTGLGLLAGLACGLALARFVRALLFEVTPFDVMSIMLPIAMLLVATVIAAIPPARRAARIDPIEALRYE